MISHQEWMDGTKEPTKRTQELQSVDNALAQYEKKGSELNFYKLGGALDTWARKKGLDANGQVKTTRKRTVVNQLINEMIQGSQGLFGIWLDHDIALARKLCDPFLKKRVIGQQLGDSAEDQAKYKAGAGQSATALFAEIRKLGHGDVNIKPSAAREANVYASQEFWLNKGATQEHAPDKSGIWCDASAALIVHLLYRNQAFRSRLDIVSQGDPKHYGHWYVIANRSDNDHLKYGFCFGPKNGFFNFAVDIWGAIKGELKSSVVHPGQAIYDCQHGTGEAYDNNNIQVQCIFDAKRL